MAGVNGSFTAGALRNITSESERVRAAMVSPDGLTRVDDGGQHRVTIPVVVVVTDQRILFVARNELGREEPTNSGSLSFCELVGSNVEDGRLALRTTGGVTWQFPLPTEDPSVVDGVVRHLRWVGNVRSRVVAARNDVELAAGRIRERADAMAWEDAFGTYRRAREDLDAVVGAVQRTDPVPDAHLAPELTELERTVEAAQAHALLQRASSRLALGRQLVGSQDFDQAREVLANAVGDWAQASHHADVVQRTDDFRFGPQRELEEAVQSVTADIAGIVDHLREEARTSVDEAAAADEPNAAVDELEAALSRYRTFEVLIDAAEAAAKELDGLEESVETSTLADETTNVVERLIERYRECMASAWSTGVTQFEADQLEDALAHFDEAIDHAERATELVERFDLSSYDSLRVRLEEMRKRAVRVRKTADRPTRRTLGSADDEPNDEDESDAESPTGNGTTRGPDARTVSEIDSHHEITFDAKPATNVRAGPEAERPAAAESERGASNGEETVDRDERRGKSREDASGRTEESEDDGARDVLTKPDRNDGE